jgi:hypothetical protein
LFLRRSSFKQLAAWRSSFSRAFSETVNAMKASLLSFCLIAATRLAAQDGLPLTPSARPPKTDSSSSGVLMGVLFSEATPSKEDIDQKGFRVTLWKVSYKDGSDDMLATLSVRSGTVGGFFIR